MKCFYHASQDAAGVCPQCGKAACHDCLKEVDGGILCKGCIAQRLKAVQAERQQVQEDRETATARAKRRIQISKIVFVIFFAMGILETIVMVYASLVSKSPNAPGFFSAILGGLMASVFLGYTAWSFYWGFPAIWNGLRKMLSKTGCFVILNPITWLILFAIFLMVVGCFGEFYCLFGGGWSQYQKRVRIARG